MKHIRHIVTNNMVLAMLLLATFASCKKDAEFFDIEDPQGIDSQIGRAHV